MGCVCSLCCRQKERSDPDSNTDTGDDGLTRLTDRPRAQRQASADASEIVHNGDLCEATDQPATSMMISNARATADRPQNHHDRARSPWAEGNSQSSSFLSKLMHGRRAFKATVRIEACDEYGNRATTDRASQRPRIDYNSRPKRESHSSLDVDSTSDREQTGKASAAFADFLAPPPRVGNKRMRSACSLPSEVSVKMDTAIPPGIEAGWRHVEVRPTRSDEVDGDSSQAELMIESEQARARSEPVNSLPIPDEGIELFTSVQQLCYQIIKERLLTNAGGGQQCGRSMCLFMFGIQGSSKGEIAFELVEHSSMMKSLKVHEEHGPESAGVDAADCPLYHYIDVAGLIVTHIDQRIRQYNALVAETLKQRKQQSASRKDSGSSRIGSEASTNASDEDDQSLSEGSKDNDADVLSHIGRNPSLSSQRSASLDSQSLQSSDSFGMVTLSTKNRSILQLKLMKYFNSITIKWIFGLIQEEIDKLESRVKMISNLWSRDRVYIVNLVPNQLSIFKTCLYLQQNLSLCNLAYPYWAIKFERRTNIKLVTKEKATEESNNRALRPDPSHSKSTASPQASSKIPIRLSNFRVPRLRIRGLEMAAKSQAKLTLGSLDKSEEKTLELATNIISNGLNEKLGPKYSENFVQQFNSLGKLIKLRYNPLKNYNYASDDFDSECYPSIVGEGNRTSCCSTLRLLQDSSRPQMQLRAMRMGKRDELRTSTEKDKIFSFSMQNLLSVDDYCQTNNSKGPRLSLTNDEISMVRPGSEASSFLNHDNSIMSSISSLVSSTSSLLSESPLEHRSRHSAQLRLNHKIKWAVELELVDQSNTKRKQPTKAATAGGFLSSVNAVDFKTLYEPPESISRSATRSPLMFSQQHKYSTNYQLVPVHVAYANGQAQLMYEIKHQHHRILKLKSTSDLQRLNKLIAKVENQLQIDCEGWLYADIFRQHPELGRPGHIRAATNVRRRRSIMGLNSTSQMINNQQGDPDKTTEIRSPSLIVYTIQVDIQRIQCRRFKFPADFEFDLPPMIVPAVRDDDAADHRIPNQQVPTLVVDDAEHQYETDASKFTAGLPMGILARPHSANAPTKEIHQSERMQRPSSSLATTVRSSPKFGRHVQFMLSQAPKTESTSRIGDQSVIQRRKWINDTLFSSCSDESICDLLNLVSILIKFSLTKMSNPEEKLLRNDSD